MAFARKRSAPPLKERVLDVAKHLDPHRRVFFKEDFRRVLRENRVDVGLAKTFRLSEFLALLKEERLFEEVLLERGDDATDALVRFVRPGTSAYSVGLSLRTGAYLSHATAMVVHGLTEQIPKVIYVNKEQSPKPSDPDSLSQESLDRAFRNAARASTYAFGYDDVRFVLLSGKATNRLEVAPIEVAPSEYVSVTKLERTLIDIAVRPTYAGGVNEVARAYVAARARVSTNLLLATLKKLNYVYPYHQAIGFYMEQAGFDAPQLDKLRGLGLKYDFYLANRISDARYDRSWRIHVPKSL